ncbi:hypothetical protein ScPMuIL_008599 [Solemya velum]
MDALKLLKAELDRKKRQLSSNSDIIAPNRKYFKRGDLVAKQEEEYWRKQNRLKDENEEKETHTVSPDTQQSIEKEEKISHLPRKEVIRKLRERNEPIILFGETDVEAYQRLKHLETLEPEIKRGEGYENDFKAALDKVDQQYLNEIVKATGSEGASVDVSIKDDGTTEEDIQKMRAELGEGGFERDQEILLKYLKFLLKMWGNLLNERPQEEKRSLKGKMASATHSQTVSYLKPLFRNLKMKKTEEGILECLVQIVKYVMDKDYLKANDAYLEMAIGNAPWPIGVTMVGIHARTGREKISSRYVAHVLNDETQRKYIQALKRLMTQCQRLFPTDPSFSVNYEKPDSGIS